MSNILKIQFLVSVPLYLFLIKNTGILFKLVVAYVKERRKKKLSVLGYSQILLRNLDL